MTPADRLRPGSPNGFETTATNVRLLIPATNVTSDLCKTILTSHILGYPSPILLNFGRQFDHGEWHDGGFHIGKIEGVAQYLEKLEMREDGELILVADAADTWFQLRAETLVSRYREVNRKLLKKAAKDMGSRAVRAAGITQNIIFGAQKDCGSPGGWDDVACYAQPESWLARDAYGSGKTDVLDPETRLPTRFRPHWLNSGFIMGSATSMRAMFRRALEKADTTEHNGSDLQIFSEIFGEQQYQREVYRSNSQGDASRAMSSVAKLFGVHAPSMLEYHPTRKPLFLTTDEPVEFGIGIDYSLEMVFSTVLSEFDGDWFLFGNKTETRQRQIKAGHSKPRLISVPRDIEDAGQPFQVFAQEASDDLSVSNVARLTWDQVPLYSNVWTGTIPAVVHLNGFEGMKSAIWHRMWYHDELRHLHGVARGLGANTQYGWIDWDNLGCNAFQAEIFPAPAETYDMPNTQDIVEAEKEAVAGSSIVAEIAASPEAANVGGAVS